MRTTGSHWKRYGYGWVTLSFFLITLLGHWLFAWFSYVSEQQAHSQPIEISDYVVQVARDTLENWQSEFLQLIWQVGGLAFLLFVGSPQSREGNDRLEAKVDELIRRIDPTDAERIIRTIDENYFGQH